jgi:hypothetical protein
MDQLDLTVAYHVEVVSFELKSKECFYGDEANEILPGFFDSIATLTMGEASN